MNNCCWLCTKLMGSHTKYMHFQPTAMIKNTPRFGCAIESSSTDSARTFFQPEGVSWLAALHSIQRKSLESNWGTWPGCVWPGVILMAMRFGLICEGLLGGKPL